MAWDDVPQIVSRLSGYLSSFDWESAESLCHDFIARLDKALEPFPAWDAKEILKRLRRKRRFRLMTLVADAILRTGQTSAQVRRQYAQAMIDLGNPIAAEAILMSVLGEQQIPAGERAEARGLLGRVYKQLYVNCNDPANPRQQTNLETAFEHYYEVYRDDPKRYLWHGINAVAMLARAQADQVCIDPAMDFKELAAAILEELEQTTEMNCWDRATAVEANVALGKLPDARRHLVFFISDSEVDSFEINSLLRQLTEVWRLVADSEPGASLLPLLSAAILKREGGEVELQKADVDCGLQAVYGTDRYDSFPWFQTGLERCKAVARIEDLMGRRVGTGFLLNANDFFDRPGAKSVLLTNAHVISPPDNRHSLAILPNEARAVFEALGQTYRIEKLLWTSPVSKLDATFLSLDGTPTCEPCPLKLPRERFIEGTQQRVYVIGYPLGGVLSISLQDSFWLDADDTLLHYRTPTAKGSSGSPVFDQKNWTVMGLHHKGKSEMMRLHGRPGTYQANEAISISAILNAMREGGSAK